MKNDFYTVLCVDTTEDHTASGRFYTGDLSSEQSFAGLDRFLLMMDAILDGEADAVPAAEHHGQLWHPGRIATFKIQILFRQNASWQGRVMWLETRHEENFRSALELMMILSQALELAQNQRMCPSSLKIVK